MLRLVLAVALAVALLAATAPALEDARATRTERLTERELDRVEAAAMTLVCEAEPGARRIFRISLPEDSPTTAPLAVVTLGGLPDEVVPADTAENDVFAYRVAGGRRHVHWVETNLRVVPDGRSIGADSQALVLDGGETYRLTLRLVRLDGRPTVAVTATVANGSRSSDSVSHILDARV